ncbi:MAG: hypothetical protein P4L40_00555 [Terracidiphilus sp.]|nr:hypothetical protein [Terracidiphilus sp.]
MPGSANAISYDSFASALEGFAASPSPAASAVSDGLEDDIATISYEKALRSQARKRPAASVKPPSPKSPAMRPQQAPRKQPVPIHIASRTPAATPAPAKPAYLRSASVTVRLTEAEQAQLRERAAAAGISASAYMRSCLVDAEALRAQVKQALEQFRAASAAPAEATPPAPQPPARRSWFFARWIGRNRVQSA